MELDVKYKKQINRHSCFVACAEMVLSAYNVEINQKRVYEKSKCVDPFNKARILGVFDADLMLAIKDKNYKMDMWMDYKRKVKYSKTMKAIYKGYKMRLRKAKRLGLIKEHRGATLNLIKKFISNGIPVIVEVHANTWLKHVLHGTSIKNPDPEETHAVVVIGYSKDNFIVNDPLMPYYSKNGKRIKVSAMHLKDSWTSPPYYKNVIFVLTKKRPK